MLFKKMVLFAIISIFDHYYKFCDVFKVKFERKTIKNVPKPNVYIVKIRNFIPKLPVLAFIRTRLFNKYPNSDSNINSTGSQGRKTRDGLGTKLFYMWSGHVMKTAFSCTLILVLCCFAMLNYSVYCKTARRFLVQWNIGLAEPSDVTFRGFFSTNVFPRIPEPNRELDKTRSCRL
jgi:hypothetical protein